MAADTKGACTRPAQLFLVVVTSWAFIIFSGCADGADHEQPTPSESAAWSVVLEEQPAALLSVWAGEDFTYAVGADPGDGPLVVRHGADGWERLHTGAEGDLWWVAPDGAGELWMVGEGGLVLRHTPGGDDFSRVDSGTDATLFGIVFAQPGMGWTVGGWVDDTTNADRPQRGAAFRVDGGKINPETRVPTDVLDRRGIFKVWARAADDVWMVGERGVLLHSVGDDFDAIPTELAPRLLTIHGAADFGPIAVGGANNAVLLELDGEQVSDHSMKVDDGFAPALNGVYVVGPERALVVGNRGFIAERDAAGRYQLLEEAPTELHLHSVTVDPDGGAWSVGGDLLSYDFNRGIVLYRGTADIAVGM